MSQRGSPPQNSHFRPAAESAAARPRVAYMMSRFPKLTETFVLFEMLAVEQQNVHIEVFPLFGRDAGVTAPDGASTWQKYRVWRSNRGRETLVHPEANRLTEQAHYEPLFSWSILMAQVWFLAARPFRYGKALVSLIRSAWGNGNFLIGGLAVFPKVAYWARQMEKLRITHVHAHFANHPATAAWLIHRLTGIPYSFTAHGSDLHRDQRMLRDKVADARFVVAVSQYNRRLIVEHCGSWCADRVLVIHCGVDTGVFCPTSRTGLCDDQPLRILCIGTLHEVKGQKFLIEACGILRDRGVHFDCRLVGDGPDRPQLAAAIQAARLEQHVHLPGACDRREVVRLLNDSDVVVAPSVPTRTGRREGIPVVLMEAMSCGLPVVASDLSGIPELVQHGHTGWLVPPGDAQALADALIELKSDSALRSRLGKAARLTIERDFDSRRNALRLAARFTRTAKRLPTQTRQPRNHHQRLSRITEPQRGRR